MKNSDDTIGNRTRDLPTCSAVPQTRKEYIIFVILIYDIFIITLDNKFPKTFCIYDEYVINLFVCIYEVRKGT